MTPLVSHSVTRVAYLLGAGATQACVSRTGTPHRLLMQDLSLDLARKVNQIVSSPPYNHSSLVHLVNTVVDEEIDFEHIITFLDNAPSALHRKLANELKRAFEEVLRERLDAIRKDVGVDPTELYAVLIDLHNIPNHPEHLQAILTTNYDEYIEKAIDRIPGTRPDFGINVTSTQTGSPGPKLLKLHGSLGWHDTLPISGHHATGDTLWIPPGIQKAKQHYPFNMLWGLAHELLHCDILRIIGCRLAPNDWDLISLLFTMRHVNYPTLPKIEVIDSPQHVETLKDQYPYLEIQSMLEVEPIGSRLVNELTGAPLRPYAQLREGDRQELIERLGTTNNWFDLWLTQKVELTYEDLDSISTPAGIVATFIQQ